MIVFLGDQVLHYEIFFINSISRIRIRIRNSFFRKYGIPPFRVIFFDFFLRSPLDNPGEFHIILI